MLSPLEAHPKPKVAVVLGNGPSLAAFNFLGNHGFATFGLNAAYRYWDEKNWYPDYYCCLDLVVGLHHTKAIRRMLENASDYGIKRFFLRRNVANLLIDSVNYDRVDVFDDFLDQGLIPNLFDVSTGSHTLLWAEHIGFRNVIIAGVDCNYVEQVEGAKEVDGILVIENEKDNPNYFFDGYQQSGDQYNIPNPRKDLHKHSWRNVAASLRPDTVVVNVSPGSKMDAFDHYHLSADYRSLEPRRRSMLYLVQHWKMIREYELPKLYKLANRVDVSKMTKSLAINISCALQGYSQFQRVFTIQGYESKITHPILAPLSEVDITELRTDHNSWLLTTRGTVSLETITGENRTSDLDNDASTWVLSCHGDMNPFLYFQFFPLKKQRRTVRQTLGTFKRKILRILGH